MGRLVNQTKRAGDRRRAGHGDNSPFTVGPGAGGLGVGQRLASIVSPTLPQHQYTNRGAGRVASNGTAPKKKPQKKPGEKK